MTEHGVAEHRERHGVEADTNAVTLIGDGPDEPIALASKAAVAGTILDRVATLLATLPIPIS